MASNEAASMPPITTVPRTCREMAPAPVAVHKGTQPRMNANAVIKIGRNLTFAPDRAASINVLPFSCSTLANSTIRMAFLADRPMSMTRPIWA